MRTALAACLPALFLAAGCVGVPGPLEGGGNGPGPDGRNPVPVLPSFPAVSFQPLRELSRELGMELTIDEDTRLCTLDDGLNRLRFAPGSEVALVNQSVVLLAAPLRMEGGEPLIPAGSSEGMRVFLVVPKPEPEPVVPPEWVVAAGRTWKYIVIHHSATDEGSATVFDDYHRKVRKWENGLGYHFVIGNGHGTGDGVVEVGDRWKRQIQGAHAGVNEYNQHGVGICLVGNFDHSRPSAGQLEAVERLIRFLMSRYRIPKEGIRLHRDVRSGTECPGSNFKLEVLLERL